MPPLMTNHGNFIVSLGDVCRWLASKAEALGVEIYPGLRRRPRCSTTRTARSSASPPATWASARNGEHKDGFTRGMELRGKYTLFAEGARGSLAKHLIDRFELAEGREPQKFGIGLKELWKVAPEKHQPGLVQHSFGWPLDNSHRRRLVPLPSRGPAGRSVGFVVHLNYSNPVRLAVRRVPALQARIRWCAPTFEGGKRISYGARAITEGGWQSVPKLTFPGGALIGCAAGFVNVPRIKGIHNAMLSGMLAAEHVAAALARGTRRRRARGLRGRLARLRRSAAT